MALHQSVLLALTVSLGVPTGTLAAQAERTRACPPAGEPTELPPLDAVLDSALAVRVFTMPDSFPPTEVLLGVRFGPDGGLAHIRPIEGNRGMDTIQVVAQAAAQVVRPQPERVPWGVRIRLHLATAPRFAVERSRFCAPELEEQPGPSVRREIAVVTPQQLSELRRARPARVRVLVGEDGSARQVELAESSGVSSIDDGVLQHYRNVRFKPALLDGWPIEAWFDNSRVRRR